MSANSKYLLQTSCLLCMWIHLFISVLQCSDVCSGVGLWGCFWLQDKTSMWGQGSPSLGDLKLSCNFWVEGSASFGAIAKSKSNLILSLPSHEFLGWFVCSMITAGKSCVVPVVVPGCTSWLILQFCCILKGCLCTNVPLASFSWGIFQAQNPVWQRRGLSAVLLYSRLVESGQLRS